jgi:hypothetical protein
VSLNRRQSGKILPLGGNGPGQKQENRQEAAHNNQFSWQKTLMHCGCILNAIGRLGYPGGSRGDAIA